MISPHFLAFNFKKINLVCCQMFRSFLTTLALLIEFEVVIMLLNDRRENGLPGEKYGRTPIFYIQSQNRSKKEFRCLLRL